MKKRRILVTMALPYANGPIHLGHLVGYIQADIWTRFQRMCGHECYYVSGSDAHGTPNMLKAEQLGVTPEAMTTEVYQNHKKDFHDFAIHFDNFYTTHSDENKHLSEMIFTRLVENNCIEKRVISQAYDAEKNMFLPDRYVKGQCPRCGAEDQYGDNCEQCGGTYAPTEVINPVSVLSGTTPIEKDSEHYFFLLSKYQSLLQEWVTQGHLQPEISNKLQELFDQGLRDWDISRDAPYFGFTIPGETDKYFYVWLDAPIGYMASFLKLCEAEQDLDFNDFWGEQSDAELYHFIGKDIINFHCLFWPAMLDGSAHRLPTGIFVNGFLTIDGQKMSKSRGTFITARQYLEYLDSECLRYYFAAKGHSGVEDVDLNLEDFMQRINSDLVGKVVNIASRCAGFINKRFDNLISKNLHKLNLYEEFVAAGDNIQKLYETRETSKAVREIMALADKANQYIDEFKPWVLVKEEDKRALAHEVCSLSLNLFKLLMTYLKPILPIMATRAEEFLQIAPMTWNNRQNPMSNHTITKFKPLLTRITPEQLAKLNDD